MMAVTVSVDTLYSDSVAFKCDIQNVSATSSTLLMEAYIDKELKHGRGNRYVLGEDLLAGTSLVVNGLIDSLKSDTTYYLVVADTIGTFLSNVVEVTLPFRILPEISIATSGFDASDVIIEATLLSPSNCGMAQWYIVADKLLVSTENGNNPFNDSGKWKVSVPLQKEFTTHNVIFGFTAFPNTSVELANITFDYMIPEVKKASNTITNTAITVPDSKISDSEGSQYHWYYTLIIVVCAILFLIGGIRVMRRRKARMAFYF